MLIVGFLDLYLSITLAFLFVESVLFAVISFSKWDSLVVLKKAGFQKVTTFLVADEATYIFFPPSRVWASFFL